MGTAAASVVHAHVGTAAPTIFWSERHLYRTTGAGQQVSAAVVGLREVSVVRSVDVEICGESQSCTSLLVTCTCIGSLVVPSVCGGKVNFVGERLTTVPAPLTGITWGFEDALSTMVNVPAKLAVVGGLKVILMAHLAPGATLVPQLLV